MFMINKFLFTISKTNLNFKQIRLLRTEMQNMATDQIVKRILVVSLQKHRRFVFDSIVSARFHRYSAKNWVQHIQDALLCFHHNFSVNLRLFQRFGDVSGPYQLDSEKTDLYSVNIITLSLITVIEIIAYSGNNYDVPEKVNLTNPFQ